MIRRTSKPSKPTTGVYAQSTLKNAQPSRKIPKNVCSPNADLSRS